MTRSTSLMLLSCALVALPLTGRPSYASTGSRTSLTIKGSDTMVHLVSTWAEAFMRTNPDVEISVTGGGSGTGIAALINGTTDICAASRNIKDSERARAQQNGRSAFETVVARDGIAIVVHPSNNVSKLSHDQLKKIYTAVYTRWNQVGGPNRPVLALSRESSSGTYVFFQEHILEQQDYAQSVRLMPATSAIIQSVSTDRGAIGYVGIGYAHDAGQRVKVLRIKATESGPAVTPSEATVRSGEYSIARPLFFYTNGAPTGAAKRFVDFCLSAEGQRIVRETGYVPVQ